MKKLLLVFVMMMVSTLGYSAEVDTIAIFSESMQKDVNCVVVVPDGVQPSSELPVVYILHGFSDDYGAWVSRTNLVELADMYSVMVVTPDGGYSSWYWDSPVDSSMRYETFVSKELICYIDSHYPTLQSRKGRAITGLSMGGHGAMYLAMRHQGIFGAVGSTSGGIDIRPFPDSWDMKKRIGERDSNPQRWLEYSAVGQLDSLKGNNLAIMFDCGSEDFFLEVNNSLHNELLQRGIPHRYMVSPGGHNWQYWSKSIQYQMLFFNSYFKTVARR